MSLKVKTGILAQMKKLGVTRCQRLITAMITRIECWTDSTLSALEYLYHQHMK